MPGKAYPSHARTPPQAHPARRVLRTSHRGADVGRRPGGSPSHGENRGSSPLGSANDFNRLVVTSDWRLDDISNFSPMGGAPHLDLASSAKRSRSSIEHNLAKVGVVGSNPLARSGFSIFVRGACATRSRRIRQLRAERSMKATGRAGDNPGNLFMGGSCGLVGRAARVWLGRPRRRGRG